MRRSDREITDKETIRRVVALCDVCRLAFNDPDEGVPYILPLNFGYEWNREGKLTLFFHGASEGRKHALMANDPHVAFEMDCNHRLVSDAERGYCTMAYQSVIGKGLLEKIDDREEKIRLLTLLTDNYHKEHFAFGMAAVDRTIVWRLTVDRLTAKQRIVKQQGL